MTCRRSRIAHRTPQSWSAGTGGDASDSSDSSDSLLPAAMGIMTPWHQPPPRDTLRRRAPGQARPQRFADKLHQKFVPNAPPPPTTEKTSPPLLTSLRTPYHTSFARLSRACIPRKEHARRLAATSSIQQHPRQRAPATMPRVTISINAPNEAADQDLLVLDLPPGLTVKDLKGFVEAETTFPAHQQSFFLNGRPLASDLQTLDDAGVKDGEMLAVLIRRRPAGSSREPARPRASRDPEDVRQHVLNDPASQDHLRQARPDLLAALHDPARWREIFTMQSRREEQAERERQEQVALLNNDPFNVDAQRKIEEIIRLDRVVENLHHAYEHNPEVFVQVHMLYINLEVNGVPVKAFVDSGAQATIMSPDCAQRCGIMRLLDTRYAGIAKGVGTAKILGRVHHAEIKIGSAVMPCAFTVMEGKDVDLLFGLDMLKRYKAKIDLEKNALCFEGIEVPFLHESEIPKSFDAAATNEPTVDGPNGTKIGGRTGTVYQEDSAQSAGPSSAEPSLPRQPPAVDPSQPPEATEFPQEHIDRLVNLGFTPQAAVQALQATGGNVEYAAGLLFDSNG